MGFYESRNLYKVPQSTIHGRLFYFLSMILKNVEVSSILLFVNEKAFENPYTVFQVE